MRDYATIVAGVPRSGTSMWMQMLRAGGMPLHSDGVRGPDADNPRGYFELEAAKRTREDPSWVRDAVGRAVKLVHVLVPALPAGFGYRIVLARRRLDAVVASQNTMLARRGAAPPALADARLAEIFRAQEDEVLRWAAGQPDVGLLEVDYDAALADPGAAAAALSRFLGGGLDERAMAAAVEPALRRARPARGAAPMRDPAGGSGPLSSPGRAAGWRRGGSR